MTAEPCVAAGGAVKRPPRADALRATLLFGAALTTLLALRAGVLALLGDGGATGIGTNRSGAVLMTLFAFVLAAGHFDRARTATDLDEMRRLAGLDRDRFGALLARRRNPRVRATCIAGFVLVGLAMVPLASRDPATMFERRALPGVLWGLLVNAPTFGLMGDLFYGLVAGRGLHAALVRAVPAVDLLEPDAFRPLARLGLRRAFFWAGGSSIASLLALDLPRLGGLLAVLVATLTLATWAFLEPMQAASGRLRREKRAELERVRAHIRAARDALLVDGADAEAIRLPALLAWEARVERVREWPLDASTLLRFAALALLATGSWLGGAVVERVLESLLGPG